MRISTQQVWRSSLDDLSRATVQQSAAQQQITSGKRVRLSSDDPAAVGRATELRTASEAIEQYTKAGNDAVAFLTAQDRELQSVLDRLTKVEELTIALANDTLPPEAREVAALEIEEIRAEIVDVANATFAGKPLFAGFADQAVDASGPTVTLLGDDGATKRRISSDDVIEINVNAADVFGFNGGTDLFTVLADIAQKGRSGDVNSLGTQSLTELKELRLNVSENLGLLGSRTSRVERTMNELAAEREELIGEVAKIENADLAEASIDLSEATLAYEAALAATARLNSVSLLNYL